MTLAILGSITSVIMMPRIGLTACRKVSLSIPSRRSANDACVARLVPMPEL